MQQLQNKWGEPDPGYEDDEQLETLHVYLVPEKQKKPRSPGQMRDRILGCATLIVCLACIVALCLIPNTPTYTISTISVPARISPLEIRASVVITPTGKQTYPATQASGLLTIYNGSFLVQQLPAHFLLTTTSGIEVTTDQTVTIPASNPPQDGIATVPAHAVGAGVGGDIPAYSVNQAYPPLFIKNPAAFTGGQDAYTVTYATKQDISNALDTARAQLLQKQPIGLTTGPCPEKASQKALTLSVVWSCQYVTYTAPQGVQVLSVRVLGTHVLLQVRKEIKPVWRYYSR
jgi:hypothetical protein